MTSKTETYNATTDTADLVFIPQLPGMRMLTKRGWEWFEAEAFDCHVFDDRGSYDRALARARAQKSLHVVEVTDDEANEQIEALRQETFDILVAEGALAYDPTNGSYLDLLETPQAELDRLVAEGRLIYDAGINRYRFAMQ